MNQISTNQARFLEAPSCFARASHILIREGARQVTASGPLRAQRTGRSWRITGDLRAPGAREGLIRLSCAVGAGWTSVELEMS